MSSFSRILCFQRTETARYRKSTKAHLSSLFFLPEGKSKKEKGAPIQRSTETGMAVELTRNMSRQPSRESNNGSMNSYNSEGKSVKHTLPVLITTNHPHTLLLLYPLFLSSSRMQYNFISVCLHFHLRFQAVVFLYFLFRLFQMPNVAQLKLLQLEINSCPTKLKHH